MTDREKELIAAYLPSPRDETLGPFEYYVMDSAGRVQRVVITGLLPHKEDMLYRVAQCKSRKSVKGWQAYDAFSKGFMYDNPQDCKDNTHGWISFWEDLRELQQKETTYL